MYNNFENIYEKSKEEYRKVFLEMLNSFNNLQLDELLGKPNVIVEQISRLEKMTRCGDYDIGKIVTIEDKKQIFTTANTRLKLDLISMLQEVPAEVRNHFGVELLCMHIYIKNITLHILNYRAYNMHYNLPIDEMTSNIIEDLNQMSNFQRKEDMLVLLESCLAKSDDIIILLINLDMFKSNIVKMHHKGNVKYENQSFFFRELFFLAYSLAVVLESSYDLTEGVDRELGDVFNEDLLLQTIGERESDKIGAIDLDYKMFEDDTKINDKLKNKLEIELKRRLGFTYKEVDKVFRFFIENVKNIMCQSRNDWLEMITRLGVKESNAEIIFCFFSSPCQSRNEVEISFSVLMNTKSKMENTVFFEVEDGYYLTEPTILNYGWNLFRQTYFNSPSVYVGSSKITDEISDSFCDDVKYCLLNVFEHSIVIRNLFLNEVCDSDREIDILFIYKQHIVIIECKRMKFAQNKMVVKNQKKLLEGKYTKQLNAELSDFINNKDKIINYLRARYEGLLESSEYKIRGYLVTKEYSLAHSNKKNTHILHVGQIRSTFRKLFSA